MGSRCNTGGAWVWALPEGERRKSTESLFLIRVQKKKSRLEREAHHLKARVKGTNEDKDDWVASLLNWGRGLTREGKGNRTATVSQEKRSIGREETFFKTKTKESPLVSKNK